MLDFRRLEGVSYLSTLVVLAQRPFCYAEAWHLIYIIDILWINYVSRLKLFKLYKEGVYNVNIKRKDLLYIYYIRVATFKL
jgi:hypothetical protein